eukprot:3552205-Pyramimonas_sp.AAC.1
MSEKPFTNEDADEMIYETDMDGDDQNNHEKKMKEALHEWEQLTANKPLWMRKAGDEISGTEPPTFLSRMADEKPVTD